MLKKMTMLLAASVFTMSTVANAEWVSFERYCRLTSLQSDCSEGIMVTGKSYFSSWAGEVIALYMPNKTITRIKIKIRWTSEESPQKCGDIIKLPPSDVKDFTHRSIIMRKCY